MKTWRRRIRAAIRMGLTWALAWFGAGMALLVVGLVFGVTADVPFPILFGLFGFLAGTAFSGVLGIVEGRRRFDQMSLPRFAVWGAVGGILLTGIFVSVAALGGGHHTTEESGGAPTRVRAGGSGICCWSVGSGQKGGEPRIARCRRGSARSGACRRPNTGAAPGQGLISPRASDPQGRRTALVQLWAGWAERRPSPDCSVHRCFVSRNLRFSSGDRRQPVEPSGPQQATGARAPRRVPERGSTPKVPLWRTGA